MMETPGNQFDPEYSPLDFEGLDIGRKFAYISLKVWLILELLFLLLINIVLAVIYCGRDVEEGDEKMN